MSLGPSRSVAARGSSDALHKVIEDLKVLRYDTLFPIGRWVQERPWELRSVQVLLFFTLFPLALCLLFQGGRNLERVVWALGLYFSIV